MSAPKKAAKPAPPPADAPKAAPAGGKLHPAQKFHMERLHRRSLREAAYNPRTIDDLAAKELRDWLKKVGLVEPLVWNKRTGNLVSGHQRLAALDALDKHAGGKGDFALDISVIDVPEKREKELNVGLNNPEIMGQYDPVKLGEMFRHDIKAEDVKFSDFQLEQLFGGTEYEDLFAPPPAPEVDEDADAINAMKNGRLDNGEAIRDPERHAAVKEEREKMRNRIAEDPLRETEFYVIVVCKTVDEQLDLATHLGSPDGKHVPSAAVFAKLGVEPTDAPDPSA